MKPLKTFFMEDFLENNRFQAQFNLGESGGRARTVQEILSLSDLSTEEGTKKFFSLTLCDSPNRGRNDLRQLIANFHPGASIDNVLVTTGTSEALFLLFRNLRPKKVALALPAFQLLYELPLAMDAEIVPLPVRFDQNGAPWIDEQEWLEIIATSKPECLLINNPHNPSGLIFNSEFLQQIKQTAKRVDCKIIADEHYRFLSSPYEVLAPTLYQNDGTTFVTGSFIKCFGTPGLRIGWCIGPKEALDAMQNEKNYTTHTVNPISEWIGFEVLKNTQSFLFQEVKKEWIQNKQILTHFLQHSKTLYGIAPNGGLVSCLGFQNATSLEETNYLINKFSLEGIFVLPLSSMEFGNYSFQQHEHYQNKKLSGLNKGLGFRLGLGCKPKQFADALHKMECILTQI
jgi:aspartate/methionine/tyrosine aminotransferase